MWRRCSRWTSLHPRAGKPQRKLYQDRLSCWVIAIVMRGLVDWLGRRGEPSCHERSDWQIIVRMSLSHEWSSSHWSSWLMVFSQSISADISLRRSTCSTSSSSCPQRGQSECSCHFQHCNHFPTPQIPVFHLESQRCLDEGRDFRLFWATFQSIDGRVWSLK